MKRCKKLPLILLLVHSFFSMAQENLLYYIDNKGIADGLPHIDVLDITEDDHGFIWFVTRAGLCRYDGFNIQTYLVNSTTDNYNRMNSMVYKNQLIWIGTEYGLICFDTNTEQFYTETSTAVTPMLQNRVQILFIDTQNNLWVDTNGQNLILKTNQHTISGITQINNPESLQKKTSILCITEDKNHNIWAGSNHGLLQFIADKNGGYTLVSTTNTWSKQHKLIDEYISAIQSDANGHLILGNYQAFQKVELDYIANSTQTNIKQITFTAFSDLRMKNATSTIDKVRYSSVKSIVCDHHNTLWFGMQTGLIKYKPQKPDEGVIFQESINKHYGLSSGIIEKLYLNRQGCIFIGTFSGGINSFDTNQKQLSLLPKDFERPENSLSESVVRAIAEEDNGNLWIGLQSKGLNHFDINTGKITYYDFAQKNRDDFNTKNNVRCMYLEENKYLWIGGLDKVFCFDIENKREIPLSPEFYEITKIQSGYFSDISADKFGNLWMTGWGKGIICCKRSKGNRTAFTDIEIINQDSINNQYFINSNAPNSICVAGNNTILFGTQNGFEVVKLTLQGDIETITHYTKDANKPNQLSNRFVWDILPIDDHTYYMATLGGGVNKVTLLPSNTTTGNYTATPLEPYPFHTESNVECLIRDKNHNLWIAGKNLTLYNEKEQRFEPYDFSQATFKNAFKVGSSFMGKSGRIYLGSTQGVLYFDPEKITPNITKPETQITQLLVQNTLIKADTLKNSILQQAISNTNHIELSYKQNNFTIWFSAMQFENPRNTKYKYTLAGFDKTWIETDGKRPFASYINLKYGTYTFRVKSSNNDGMWNETPRELIIKIRPPFYLTNMAYLIYLAIILLIIRLIILYQTRYYAIAKDLEVEREKEQRNEEIFQEKASFFTHLSHELRTPLTLIFSPLKEIIDNEKETRLKNQLGFVYKNVERMIYIINKLIEFRKVESGVSQLIVHKSDIHSFVNQIAQQFTDWAGRKNISYTISIASQPEQMWFDHEKVESIVYNLLTNAFKYTPDNGTIDITIISHQADVSMKNMRKTHHIGHKPEDRISIIISDNGNGIAQENLERVFDSFYRDNIRVSEGFGIGLSLVKRLIILHKGYLEISSTTGGGTDVLVSLSKSDTFYTPDELAYTIPNIKTPGLAPEDINAEIAYEDYIVNESTYEQLSQQNITGKVLIIEDDTQIRNYLRINLSKFFTVFDISHGEKGYELVTTSKPDIVICDVMLPDADGIEICRKIKQNPETAHIPVVIVTAKTDISVRFAAAKAGADFFIEKPFSLSFLITELMNILINRNHLITKLSKNVFQEAYTLSSNQKDSDFIKKIIALIKEKMDNPDFLVDNLCTEVGMARSNFYSRVKQITGKTPNDLIRDMRLEEAISQMANHGLSVSEAAYKVGMSPTYFSKAFKAKFSKTPSEYLRDIK